MTAKSTARIAVSSLILNFVNPVVTTTLNTTAKVVEAKLAPVKEAAETESQWSLIAFQDLKEELNALKAEVKELKR